MCTLGQVTVGPVGTTRGGTLRWQSAPFQLQADFHLGYESVSQCGKMPNNAWIPLFFSLQFSFIFLEIFKWIQVNFSSPKEWNWSWFHLSQDPGSWSYTNPQFVHMSVFENTLVHVFFLCDSIGVFIIQREKRVCKESGTLVFISFPSRASSRPRLSRGLPAKRGGGLSGKGGSILYRRGCWGYSWWLLFVHILINTIKNIL